jgi:hypothetical protein
MTFPCIPWLTLNCYLYGTEEKDLISVFSMQISSFPSTIYERGCLFSNVCFRLLYQKSDDCNGVDLCLSLLFHCSSCLFLYQCYDALSLWLCSGVLKSGMVIPPVLLFFLSTAFTIRGLLCFHYVL